MALITRAARLASASASIRGSARATTCQDAPERSLSQPQTCVSQPANRHRQYSSTSNRVLKLTTMETSGVNSLCGPPFDATNSWPSSSNAAVITPPFGPGPASP